MTFHKLVPFLPLALFFQHPASGQSVISAHSGVIHFSEGTVLVDDQPVEQKLGKFHDVNDGSELRTLDGRAEVLLTPGVFLRVGENSAIRMISNDLTNTRVELLNGSAIVESDDVAPRTAITMSYREFQVHFEKNGQYRFNTDPAEIKVYKGEAEVLLGGKPVEVEDGQALSFATPLACRKLENQSGDALDHWATARNESIAENNVTTGDPDNPDWSGGLGGNPDLSGLMGTWQTSPDSLAPLYGSAYVPMNNLMMGNMPFSMWGGFPGSPVALFAMPIPLYGRYYIPGYGRLGSSGYLGLGNPGYRGLSTPGYLGAPRPLGSVGAARPGAGRVITPTPNAPRSIGVPRGGAGAPVHAAPHGIGHR